MESEIANKTQAEPGTPGSSDSIFLWVNEARSIPESYLLRKEAFESLKHGEYEVTLALTTEQLESNVKAGKSQSLDQSLGYYVLGRIREAQGKNLDAAKAYETSAVMSWHLQGKKTKYEVDNSSNQDKDLPAEVARKAANCYQLAGQKDKAEPLLRQIVAHDYLTFKGDQTLFFDSLSLANSLQTADKFMQAELVYEGLLSKFEENKVNKFVQSKTAFVLENLANCEEKQGKLVEAWVHYSRSAYLKGSQKNIPENRKTKEESNYKIPPVAEGKIKKEIANAAKDPRETLLEAVKHNRVLAIGEFHTMGAPNMHRTFVASLMQDFKKSGVTHLALELPADEQWKVDQFVKTGKFPIAATKRSNEFTELGLGLYSKSLDYVLIMDQARKAGLKIRAVDSAHLEQFSFYDNLHKPRRNQDMSKTISEILRTDKNNRVVFFGGSWHTANSHPKNFPATATELLRQEGYRVSTSYAALSEPELFCLNQPLDKYRSHFQKNIAIESAQTPQLSSLPVYSNEATGRQHKLGFWNTVLIYPNLSQQSRETWVRSIFPDTNAKP